MNNIWLNKKTPVGFIGCFYNIHFWVMLKGRRKKESTEFLYCCNPGVKGEQSHGRGRGRQADAAARQVWEADDGREGRALQSISHQTFSFKQTVNLKGTVVITNLTFWLTRTCEFHPVIPPSDPVTNRWIRPHLLKEIWSYWTMSRGFTSTTFLSDLFKWLKTAPAATCTSFSIWHYLASASNHRLLSWLVC